MSNLSRASIASLIELPFVAQSDTAVPPEHVEDYINELLSFLKAQSLLHSTHPEDFFSSGFGGGGAEVKKVEGSKDESQGSNSQLFEWISTLGTVLTGGSDSTFGVNAKALQELSALTSFSRKDQEENSWETIKLKSPSLFQLGEDCRRLRLQRAPLPPSQCLFSPPVTSTSSQQDAPPMIPLKDKSKLSKVLSNGMCSKKKHEVERMYQGVVAVADESSAHANSNSRDDGRRTISNIINIGEGKGYLSRTLALVKGLQVVGLDCNPHHRDTSFERVDRTLVSELSADGESFLYQPRGAMSSLTCRVGANLDWSSVLEEHNGSCSGGHYASVTGMDSSERSKREREGLEATSVSTSSSLAAGGGVAKVQCIATGKIMRAHPPFMLTHLLTHLKGRTTMVAVQEDNGTVVEKEVDASAENIQHWFKPFIHEGSDLEKKKKAGLSVTALTRGTRVKISAQNGLPKTTSCSTSTDQSQEEEEVLTVLGFNDSTQEHKVLRHLNGAKCSIFLSNSDSEKNNEILDAAFGVNVDELEVDAAPSRPQQVDESLLEKMKKRREARNRVVTCRYIVVPQVEETKSKVDITLKDSMVIGLHTCGNLGSNSLRLWVNSQSPRLMLVSCCWHALTSEGFPMSSWVRSTGLQPSPLSLMLATQPVTEELKDADLDGYIGSKKLLFFRAMLALVWENGAGKCSSCYSGRAEDRNVVVSEDGSTALPPSFLRKMAKKKQTLSFEEFVLAIEDEGLAPKSNDDKKLTREELSLKAKEISESHMKQFPAFLGFMVLRMWLAQLMETGLLVDRLLFLAEELANRGNIPQNSSPLVKLIPLFEGSLSPRNYAIVARRP